MKKTILQRILKTENRQAEVNAEDGSVRREEQRSERVRNYSGVAGGSWIVKRGNYSPRNQIGPIRTNAMKAADRSGHSDPYSIFSPRSPRTNFGSSPTHPEMFDLETIICEFEKGFLSPSKHEGQTEIGKQRNFVKKIVAAFEVKYKASNDPRGGQEGEAAGGSAAYPDTSCDEGGEVANKIFESISFDAPITNLHGESMMMMMNEFENHRGSASDSIPHSQLGETFLAWPSVSSSSEDGLIDLRKNKKYDEEGNEEGSSLPISNDCLRELAIFSSTNDLDVNQASCPLDLARRDSSDSDYSLCKYDEEVSYRRSSLHVDSNVAECLDDTMIVDDTMVLDLTLRKQGDISSTENGFFPKRSDKFLEQDEQEEHLEEEEEEQERQKEEEVEAGQISRNDKIPKIVGAFLKRPIEVEDTSIDWIPIPGKKLPRKKSLKKLLYSLTGKRLDKKRKLFSSERNLNEGEYQDSGFDEISCSSSSLTSLASITDMLGKVREYSNSLLDSSKEVTFKTFKSKELEKEEDKASKQGDENAKRLILNEVPRETLRIDLSPCYPPLNFITDMAMKAMKSDLLGPTTETENLTKLPKHPHLSKIRKHPFVSLSKMDNSQEFCSSYVYKTGQNSSVIIKNDMYEVEIRRRSEDVCPFSRHSSSTAAASHYDVPRKFLSKSETNIWAKCQCCEKKEPIYDEPRLQIIERSKSSDYEDVLSFERRSVTEDEEDSIVHYANGDNANCLNDEMRLDV